jgi:hypothetical protein
LQDGLPVQIRLCHAEVGRSRSSEARRGPDAWCQAIAFSAASVNSSMRSKFRY